MSKWQKLKIVKKKTKILHLIQGITELIICLAIKLYMKYSMFHYLKYNIVKMNVIE